MGYLETLPQAALARLYTSIWTCKAVFRGLPPLGKLYALRLLFLDVSTAFPEHSMSSRQKY